MTADPGAAHQERLDEDRAERHDRIENPGRGLLTFHLGTAAYGVWVDEVLEILRTPPITRLPLAAPEVAGVTSVRGVVIPVLDLGRRLRGEPAARPGRLILVRHEASGSMVGLLVESVGTLLGVREHELGEPPPEARAGLPAGWITAVADSEGEVVTVLHLGEVAAPPGTSTED